MTRRRANQEGTLHERKDGRWAGALSLEGRRKYVYGRTKAEAAAKLRVLQRATEDGLDLPDARLTVGAYLLRWLQDSARPRLRPRTFEDYESVVRLHLIPGLGAQRLSKLAPNVVQRYLNDQVELGLSPQSARNHHAVLRTALTQAERWGLVARNVAKLVSPPRSRRVEIVPLTGDQARSFVEAVRGDRLEALYLTALSLGLRQGEVLGLVWENVDLEARTLQVDAALQRQGGAYHRVEPKTWRSRRTLDLPPQLAERLRAHRLQQLEERLRAGDRWPGDGWDLVFTTTAGQPLSGAVVTHRFQDILVRAGLPRRRFHDLRHSAASFMLAQGVPLRVVMEVLGHSDIATTGNIYAHVARELTRDATVRVEAVLWGES